jgi:hypothetical protein
MFEGRNTRQTKPLLLLACYFLLLAPSYAYGASVSAGAAPQGDAKTVATRIIKYNFPNCKRITRASRSADGTILATCDSVDYYVFTLYDGKAGKMHEVALNCDVSKKQLGVVCPSR